MPKSRYSQDWKNQSSVDWSKYDPHYSDKEREKEDQAAGSWEVQAPAELEIDKPNPTPDIDPSLSDAGRSMFSKTLDLLSPTKFSTPAPVPMTDQGKTELGNTLNLMDPNKWSMASGLSSLAQNPIQTPSPDPAQGPPSPARGFWDGFEDAFGEPGKTISNAAGTLWNETKQAGDYAGQFADQVENGFDSFTQQAKDAQKNSFMTRGLNSLGDSLGSVADVADNAAKGTFQQAKDATKDSVFTRGFSQPNMPNRNLFDETMASQRAGTADILETAGNTAEWAGENLANAADTIGLKTFANDIRTGSVKTGTQFRNDANVQKNGFEIQPDHEFTWSDLLDPHAYARWSRSVPLSASLMSMSFAGGGIADTLGFVKNASPFVRELLTAGGAGAFSGAVESAVQAGNIYEEARTANKMDPQTALHAANIDFLKNLPLLMGSNALEFATAFMPKGVSKAMDTPLGQVGRFIGSGLQEGGEEAAQEVIDRQALGKEVKWDANMKEQFTVGALMGMGMGTAGVIMHNMDSIVNRVKGKMNDETRAEFNDLMEEAKTAGIPEEEATKQALDALAEHPDAKPLFEEAVQEVMQSQQTAAQAKAPVDESIQKVIDGAGEEPADEQPHDEAFQKLLDDISKQLNPQADGKPSDEAQKLMEETKAQEAAQQANARPEDTLVGYDPQNPGDVAFRSPDYDKEMAVVEQYNRLKEQMGGRAPKIPGGLTHTPDGDVSGRFGPVSQAPEWLQDFRKENNRLPNQQELGELARKHVTEGYRDGGTRVPSLQEQQIQDELDHVTQLFEQAPEHEREGLMETAQHLMDALAEIQTKGSAAPAAQETPAPENGKFYTPQELEGFLGGGQSMTPRQEEYEKVRKAFPEANLEPYQQAPSNQAQAPAETKPAGAANVGDTVTLRGMKGSYTVTSTSGKDMLKLKSESGGEVTVHKSAVTGLAGTPVTSAKKDSYTVGDVVTMVKSAGFSKGKDQKYTVIGALDKNEYKLRGEDGTEVKINKAGISGVVGKHDFSEAELDQLLGQQEYETLRGQLTTDSRGWKDSTKAAHLEKMKLLAEENGIEFQPRYQQLLEKFSATATEYKNRNRKEKSESWQDAGKRLTKEELTWELEHLTGKDLRNLRDSLEMPKKGNGMKNVIVSQLVEHLHESKAEAPKKPKHADFKVLGDIRADFETGKFDSLDAWKKQASPAQLEAYRLDAKFVDDLWKKFGNGSPIPTKEELAKMDRQQLISLKLQHFFSGDNTDRTEEQRKRSEEVLSLLQQETDRRDGKESTPEEKAPNVLNAHHARMKERARLAQERINANYGSGGNTLNSGIPLDLMADLTVVGYTKILDGVADFKAWSEEVLAEQKPELRDRIKRWLPGVFAQAQHIHSLPDHEADAFIDELLIDAHGENPDAGIKVNSVDEAIVDGMKAERGKSDTHGLKVGDFVRDKGETRTTKDAKGRDNTFTFADHYGTIVDFETRGGTTYAQVKRPYKNKQVPDQKSNQGWTDVKKLENFNHIPENRRDELALIDTDKYGFSASEQRNKDQAALLDSILNGEAKRETSAKKEVNSDWAEYKAKHNLPRIMEDPNKLSTDDLEYIVEIASGEWMMHVDQKYKNLYKKYAEKVFKQRLKEETKPVSEWTDEELKAVISTNREADREFQRRKQARWDDEKKNLKLEVKRGDRIVYTRDDGEEKTATVHRINVNTPNYISVEDDDKSGRWWIYIDKNNVRMLDEAAESSKDDLTWQQKAEELSSNELRTELGKLDIAQLKEIIKEYAISGGSKLGTKQQAYVDFVHHSLRLMNRLEEKKAAKEVDGEKEIQKAFDRIESANLRPVQKSKVLAMIRGYEDGTTDLRVDDVYFAPVVEDRNFAIVYFTNVKENRYGAVSFMYTGEVSADDVSDKPRSQLKQLAHFDWNEREIVYQGKTDYTGLTKKDTTREQQAQRLRDSIDNAKKQGEAAKPSRYSTDELFGLQSELNGASQSKFENLHFALSGNADEMEMIRRQKPKAILMSYGSRWERNGKIKEFVDSLGYRPVTIADNGAYSKKDTGLWDVMDFFENEWTTSPGSAWNTIKEAQQSAEFATKQGKSYMVSDGAKEIKKMFPEFIKFVDWLESNQGAMDYVIAPDDLTGDIEERSAKALYAYQFFKGSDAYNFIPAFHYGADLSHLKDLIDEGADYIALGGSVYDPDVVDSKGKPTLMGIGKRAAWVNSIVNQHPDIKFHLLGTNSQGLLNLIPNIYSVDGSTWGRNSFQKESGFENRVESGSKEIEKRETAAHGKKADPGTFTLPAGIDGYNMTKNEVTYYVVKHLFDTIPSLAEIVQDNNVNDASRKIKKELMKQKFKAKGSGFSIEVLDDPKNASKDDAEAGIYIDVHKHGAKLRDQFAEINNFPNDVVKLYKERISQGLGPVPQTKASEDLSNVVEDGDRIRITHKDTGEQYTGIYQSYPSRGYILKLDDGPVATIDENMADHYTMEVLEKAKRSPYDAKIGKNIDFSADGGRGKEMEVWHKDHPNDAVTIYGYGNARDAEFSYNGEQIKNATLVEAMEWASNQLTKKYGKAEQPKAEQLSSKSFEQQLAGKLKAMIHQGQEIKAGDLFKAADQVFKGTQAEGRYTPKDAYDALELAVNQYLLEQMEFKPPLMDLTATDTHTVKENVQKLMDLTKLLPTQTKRTEDQEKFQQFSTPPAIAYVANWVAGINENDVVLEPSAGIGGLAVFAKANGAQVVVNELDPRRLEVVKNMPFDRFFKEDGEQINNILPKDVKPTVVIMNPPFSTSATRGVTNTKNSFNHVEQALKRLEPGGRLVAILGLSRDGARTKGFMDWMKKLQGTYNVRAVMGLDGKNYTKYGTNFDVQYLVIDKTGPTTNETLLDTVGTLDQAITKLEAITNDKQRTAAGDRQSQSTADQPASAPTAEKNPSGTSSGVDSRRPGTPGTADGVGNQQPTGTVGNAGGTTRPAVPSGANHEPGPADQGIELGQFGEPSLESQDSGQTDSGAVGTEDGGQGNPRNRVKKPLTDSVFEDYVPKKLRLNNVKRHPGTLAESAAMSAIEPPDLTYKPAIPDQVIQSGKLSDAQLEAISYAGQAHEGMLENGERRGFFIGDGTGVGKGREISGIILDNFMQGRKKAVWVTMNDGLLPSARRDWSDLGGSTNDIFEAPKISDDIKQKDGILFTKYGTIRGGVSEGADGKVKLDDKKGSRIAQIVKWLGKDFDGVIAFDEAHNMANATATKGSRGSKGASNVALAGLELQRQLPKARIVYVSATGATEVSNLAYAERLGLWGPGTAFANKMDFISKISEGGIAAMELVARDMKAMGMYIARNLSYDGVSYEKMTHKLTKDQREIYDTLAGSWQIVLQNIHAALEEIGAVSSDGKTNGNAKGRAIGQFWGAQQRFFNQVLTSMQMPKVIEEVKKDLADGKAVVMQLVNTNAATQERGIAKMQEEEGSLDDVDLTPRDIILQFLDSSFPVQQYESYVDDDGNERTRPVVDSEGNAVINQEAQARKDALMERVSTLKVPEGPIEIVLNTFGVENVAEITGRSRRIIEKVNEDNGRTERVLENRSSQAGEADATAFMAGEKNILIFSNAGGTGRSYHADLTKKNQKKRSHYLIQAGWEATKAVQGFGRTHRTNQASAPVYKLFTTDLKGQMRFVSSIARRLDQLGALTKGQRQTGSQGFFNSSDNLEGQIAKDALELFYTQLAQDQIPGLNRNEVLEQMGLKDKILDEYGRINRNAPELNEITKFLNRILVLKSDTQNLVFESFQHIMEDLTQTAIEKGLVDTGLENLKSDKARVVEEVEIRKDEQNGSTTTYNQVELSNKSVPMTLKKAKDFFGADDFAGVYRNERSKAVKALFERGSKTLANGSIVKRYVMQGQERNDWRIIDEVELEKSTWKKFDDQEDAEDIWNAEMKNLPEYQTSTVHVISGTLLPVWNRLPNTRTRVVRIALDNGDTLLGRVIPENTINNTLHKLGAERRSQQVDLDTLAPKVLEDNYSVVFANGWKIVRRKLSGEWRMELIGDDMFKHSANLRAAGVFAEKIGYQYRYFIPTDSKAAGVLKNIVKTTPISEVVPPDEQKAQTFIPAKTVNNANQASSKQFMNQTYKGPVTKAQIMTFIMKEFKVPIGTRRFKGKARAIYKPFVNEIRLKSFGDFVAIAHELGHNLDNNYGFSEKPTPSIKRELEQLASTLAIPSSYTQAETRAEGFAEFTRLFLFDPNKAEADAPNLFTKFTETLDRAGKADAIYHLQGMMDRWYSQSADERIDGVTDLGGKGTAPKTFTELMGKVKRAKNKAYDLLYDELAGMDRALRDMLGDDVKDLAGSKNPFLLAQQTRGTAGRIKAFMEHGIMDDEGNKIGKSLDEVLSGVPDLAMFRRYVEALRAKELHLQGKYLTPISEEDAQQRIDGIEQGPDAKVYMDARDDLYAYEDAVTDELVRAGMLSARKVAGWKKEHKFYVPFYRVMEESGERSGSKGSGADKKFANLQDPIKGMKDIGSARPIIDPLESIIKNTYLFISLAERNKVGVAWADLADNTEDSADIMVRVANPTKVNSFTLEDIADDLEKAGFDLSDPSVDLQAVAKLFSQTFTPSATDKILNVWRNGKIQQYQIRNEDLYNAFVNLDPKPMNALVKMLAIPNQVLRTGITLAPSFIPKNPMRSIFSLLVLSDSFTTPKDYMQLPAMLIKNLAGTIKKGDAYWKWASTGGAQSTLASIENEYVKDGSDLILRGTWKQKMLRGLKSAGIKPALQALRKLTELGDEPVRLSEQQMALKKTGDTTTAATRSRDIDIDFVRSGSGTRTINQIDIFFNVALQGPDKIMRTFKEHPVRTTIRGTLFITLPTLALLMANWDDDDYWELPQWRRDLFWNIKIPGTKQFFFYPMPFELGLIFKMIPERLIADFYKKSNRSPKEEVSSFLKTALEVLTPSVIPTYLIGGIQWATNAKIGNLVTSLLFGEKPIATVPQRLMDEKPENQVKPGTSDTARLLGKATGQSPIKIDQAITDTTSTLGRAVVSGADAAMRATGITNPPPKPSGEKNMFEQAFIGKPSDSSSASVDEFYKKLDAANAAYDDKKAKGSHFLPYSLKTMRKTSDELAAMRSISDLVYASEKLTPDQKQAMLDRMKSGITDLARKATGKTPLDAANMSKASSNATMFLHMRAGKMDPQKIVDGMGKSAK